MTEDYRDTVFLPKTDFPMKAGLAQKEPAILERWRATDLYGQLRRARAGRERYIFHDGPPYANGNIHIGHAQNKILKDLVVRAHSLLGYDAPFVPGWDCHGLPIEWKVEEGYRARKQDKDQVPVGEFRRECRAYAAQWVSVQSEQFQRLGVLADWATPYLTMDFAAEAAIAAELIKFAESGQVYRGAKPVMWSPVERTALADAEVEYEDITSTQIDVGFAIVEAPGAPHLVGAYAVIWTTTPWTIPTNQAIAYAPDVDYVVLEVVQDASGAALRLLVAKPLVAALEQRLTGSARVVRVTEGAPGTALAGARAHHPMHALGDPFYQTPRPFLPGDFVTTDAGTGLVHMAPDHGEDDFLLCKAHGIDPVFAVGDDGRFRVDWPWLGGHPLSVISPKLNAPEGPICADLAAAGALMAARADYRHSYPHSWRSKAKVIQRCTPQWFIAMDKPLADSPEDTLRARALKAIRATRWVPAKGENRITAMVEGRPDWVISRQRAWGVPIPLYVHRKTGAIISDPGVNGRILDAFRERGADAWFDADHSALLGADYKLDDFEPVRDILDVWFDSGSTHAFVVEARYGAGARADLYLEGSDQHRGWFQSSLLESCGTRGVAPYKTVVTHGFALDGQGRKMSKSLGNTVDPLKVIQTSGADILRLWVASTDASEDVRISNEVLSGASDAYRKLRNSFRYLLGALQGFTEDEALPSADMPELERYLLDRLAALDGELRAAIEALEFARYTRALVDFANIDLSAFFFDIRKDSLYCDAPDSPKRRAYRTVLDRLFHALVRYAAPILPFTTEEVWQTRFGPDAASVHLSEWPEVDAHWRDAALAERWARIREARARITDAIEPLRRDKRIGSSLEAEVMLEGLDPELATQVDLAEVAIVASVIPATSTQVTATGHHKCGRCWRHLPDILADGALCGRCADVVGGASKKAQTL